MKNSDIAFEYNFTLSKNMGDSVLSKEDIAKLFTLADELKSDLEVMKAHEDECPNINYYDTLGRLADKLQNIDELSVVVAQLTQELAEAKASLKKAKDYVKLLEQGLPTKVKPKIKTYDKKFREFLELLETLEPILPMDELPALGYVKSFKF